MRPNHVSFSLSSTDGEHVILTEPNGVNIVDRLSFPPQFDNISYGLNSANNLVYFSPSSPGNANIDANAFTGILSEPKFSKKGGFFNSPFSLTLSHTEPGTTIYYTLDGSEPDPNNLSGTTYSYKNDYSSSNQVIPGNQLTRSYITLPYTSSILITDRSSTPNQISTISTTSESSHPYKPSGTINKATIVRAIALKNGFLPSEIITNTYIYNSQSQNPYSFPIVSLVTQENNLFDYQTGIYTPGRLFDQFKIQFPDSSIECGAGNFTQSGSAWERRANMEFLTSNSQVLNQNISIRIHGGCTRTFPYKSIRLYGKDKFDNYPFFLDYPQLTHNRLILRNSGNDQFGSLFKDIFIGEWMRHLNFSLQNARPSVLYLNGEYWGVHNIRERFDSYYFENKYGAKKVDLREFNYFEPDEMSEGDDVHYWKMYNFIMNNNMAVNANYNHASTLIDVESVIDFFIAHSYIGNIDWPQNNVRMWRSKNDFDATKGQLDGRWRYVFYDTDRALGELVNAQHNDFTYMSQRNNSELFVKLLKNVDFKNKTINRLNDLLNTSFKYDYAKNILTQLQNSYKPEVQQHIERWKNISSLNEWNSKIQQMDQYIFNRYQNIDNLMTEYFGVKQKKEINLSANLTQGHVQINSIEIDPNITKGVNLTNNLWNGKYHVEVPITLKPISKKGYKFKHWIHNNQIIQTEELTIVLDQNKTYEAIFEYTGISTNPIPSEVAVLSKCYYEFNHWDPNSPAGTFPKNSAFIHMNKSNPGINDIPEETHLVSGKYNLKSQTRITGHNNQGFSFINTGDANEGYPSGALGGFIVAINTTDLNTVRIDWTAKTFTSNPRKYNLRLLYRVGDVEQFKPFGPIYASGSNDHTQAFSNIELPAEAINKPYVQLLWQYYDTKTVNSGARDQLGITYIKIKGEVFKPNERLNLVQDSTPHSIKSNYGVQPLEKVIKTASGEVEFLPGFEAQPGSTLLVEIKNCPL